MVLHLVGQGGHEGRGFGILMALELAAQRPKMLRSARIPVLFASQDAEGRIGKAGILRLELLREGPSGLHPDPANMAFLRVDPAVVASLLNAWESSDLRESDACVVWSVTVERANPARIITGSSMGAACAIALDDLAPRWVRLRRLRPRKLANDCTATAGLSGRELTPVTHYGEKFTAAQQHSLRVVVAADAVPTALTQRPAGYPAERILGAKTLSEAIKLTRTAINPALYAVAASVLVIALVCGAGGYLWYQSSLRGERATVAASLATKSGELLNRDSRMSALLALAADRLNSTPASRNAMTNAIQNNQAIVASAPAAQGGPVTAVAAASDVLLTADRSPTVKVWTLSTMKPLGQIQLDMAPSGVVAAPYGDEFAIATSTTLGIYQGAKGRVPTLVKSLPTPASSHNTRTALIGPFYDDETGAIVLIDGAGDGLYWSPKSNAGIPFSLPTSGGVVAAGGFRHVSGGGDARHCSVLVATGQQQLLRLTFADGESQSDQSPPSPQVETVVPTGEVRAPIVSVAYGDLATNGDSAAILIGTEHGIQQWDPNRSMTVSFPYAGLAEQAIQMLPSWGGGTTVVTPSGLKLLNRYGVTALNNTTGASTATGIVKSVARAEKSQLVEGRSDGRVVVLDPLNRRLGLEDRPKSNVVSFAGSNILLTTSSDGPQRISSLHVSSVSPPTPNSTGTTDPAYKQYALPQSNGTAPYVNDAVASDRVIVASGNTNTNKTGKIWVWDRESTNLVREIDFSASGDRTGYDLVTFVAIAPALNRIAALNLRLGEVGIWSTTDWQRVATIRVRPPENFDETAATTMSSSADGSVLLVQVSAQRQEDSHQVLIDLAHNNASRAIPIGGRTVLAPDGQRFAAMTHGQDLAVYTLDGKQIGETFDLKTDIQNVAWRPDGHEVAVSLPRARQIVFINPETMQPEGPPWNSLDQTEPYRQAWSTDGSLLAVTTAITTNDGRIVPGPVEIFRPHVIDWRGALCAIAGTDMTDAEWEANAGTSLRRPELCS
ncbi:hypothetical protein A5732_20105 [Mycobacterium colombiense]|nr:hypothetical protein A5732_20105 [Mycobacterium colombiense]